jgi:hypothetical protein
MVSRIGEVVDGGEVLGRRGRKGYTGVFKKRKEGRVTLVFSSGCAARDT